MKIETNDGIVYLRSLPDKCPFCRRLIIAVPHGGFLTKKHGNLSVLCSCPSESCKKAFIAYYYHFSEDHYTYGVKTSFGAPGAKVFSKTIERISKSFTAIYNEAFEAEKYGLLEICGVCYRKALEFLIKDYTILKHSTEREKIENLFVGEVITKYISDDRVKNSSKRAAWLRNEETHYMRKWDGKDLADLKAFIDLITYWIEFTEKVNEIEAAMPK